MSRASRLLPFAGLLIVSLGTPAAGTPMFPNPTDEIGTVNTVVSGDFNGDGHGDAIIADGSSNLKILIGIGDGTFAPPVLLATGLPIVRRMSTADFDGDGRLDLALLVYDVVAGHGTNTRVLLFHGRGGGSFDPPVPSFIANDVAIALATVDFNGDGAPDAVVLTGTMVCRLFNSGTGTLNAPLCQTWTGPYLGFDMAVGDFNSDGRPDLVVDEGVSTSDGGVSVQVLFNNGPTGFSAPVTVVSNGFAGMIASADLNGDGHADIVYTIFPEANDPNSYVRVHYGDGAGGFSGPVSYVGSSCCGVLGVADLDGDGRLDIVSAGTGIIVHPGLPGGGFGPARVLATGEDFKSAALSNLDGDNRIDLVASMNRYTGSNFGDSDALRSYLGTADGRFGMTSLGDGASSDVASADMNGDGKADLVVVEHNDNRLAVLLSHGDGTFAAPLRFPCGTSPQGLALGDFDRDGRIDAVTGLNGSLALLLGNGDGTLAAPQAISGGDLHTQVIAADFNADGTLDLATNNQQSQDVSVFWNYIVPTWGMGREPLNSWLPTALATGDVDGDGILDIVTGSIPDRNFTLALAVQHGRGDGTFDAPQSLMTWTSLSFAKVSHIVIADFNGDGIPDLAASTFFRTGDVSVFFGQGHGAFGPRVSVRGGSTPAALAAADIDRDGGIDLAVAYADSADVAIFEADGAGGFLPPQRFGTATPADLVTGDFNGDGLIDFALATPEAVASVVLGLPANGGHDPVAAAGPDRSSCVGVVLDGSASSDPDSTPGTNDDIVSFEWFENFGLPSQTTLGEGRTLPVSLPLGVHAITLRVTDSTGRTATDALLLTVVDTPPPTGTIALSPGALWPPNHRMENVSAQVTASDLCGGPVTITLDSVISSEPDDAPGGGDGQTTGDIAGVAAGTADFAFALRAERSSTGPGRTYTVTYRLTDSVGNTALVSGTVAVSHDLSGVTDPLTLQVSTTQDPDTLQWSYSLSWNAVFGASRYDVATGPLAALVHLDPTAGGSPPACLADQIPADTTSLLLPDMPLSPGSVLFYMVDYVNSSAPTSGRSGYGSEGGQFDVTPVVPIDICP